MSQKNKYGFSKNVHDIVRDALENKNISAFLSDSDNMFYGTVHGYIEQAIIKEVLGQVVAEMKWELLNIKDGVLKDAVDYYVKNVINRLKI